MGFVSVFCSVAFIGNGPYPAPSFVLLFLLTMVEHKQQYVHKSIGHTRSDASLMVIWQQYGLPVNNESTNFHPHMRIT